MNETQLNYINVTDLSLHVECEMLVVAINDVGTVASRQIRVRIGMPYAQFGTFAIWIRGRIGGLNTD